MWIQYSLVDVRNLDIIEKKNFDVETDVKVHKLIMVQWQELIKHNEYLGVAPKEISVLIRWAISHSLGARIYIKTGFNYAREIGYTGVPQIYEYLLSESQPSIRGTTKWVDFIICLIRVVEKLTGRRNLGSLLPCRSVTYMEQIEWLIKFYLRFYNSKSDEWE